MANYTSDMIRMQNEYRALLLKAKMTRAKNDGPSQAECVLYQEAAMLCGKMRQISKDDEKQHWEQELISMNEKIEEIRRALDPHYDDAKSSGNQNTAATVSDDDAVTAKMVQSWYKPMPKHGFADVSGMKDVIERLNECKADAQSNELREYLGMGTVHSFFFVGPPGCGKTYLIEAFAHELMTQEYKFLSLEGSDVLSRYVGDAQKIVKRLFEEMIRLDNCIVFIDEVESLCRNRASEGLPEWAADITTAFLTGYNKLVDCNKNIIFIGATNFPNDVDDAMFDRVEAIRVGLPDTDARNQAFKRALSKKFHLALEPGFDYMDMAEATENYNYRDIDRLVSAIKKKIIKACNTEYSNQAEALEALKNGQFLFTREMFDACRNSTRPSQKDGIMAELDKWEKRFENKEVE